VRKIKSSIIFLVFLVFLFLVCFSWWQWATAPFCVNNCQAKIFVISKGESLSSVAKRLEEENLIRSSFAFQILATKEGIVRKIQAGDFRLNPQMTPLEIARELTHGTLDRWVTIIEGLRREQIAEKFEEAGFENFKKEEFLERSKNLEGKLFPDTYLIPKDANAQEIIEILTKNFFKKTPMPSKEVLILSSIVEREAKFEEDRPIVAGILLKRLKNGWPLQADATVQYAVANKQSSSLTIEQLKNFDWWPKNLTREDLKIKSPYNTYLYPGLPPAPICNPGLKAIEAVLNPVETDFWFYLSDKEGKMHYAKTAEEHQENIKRYLL
jgi:UPF0755 protein